MKQLYLISAVIALHLILYGSRKAKASLFFRKVDSIQIVFDNKQLVLPGESFQIGVISYRKNKIKKTVGILDGSSLWWRYKVEVVGGTNRGGNIFVNNKLMPSKGKYIQIAVQPKNKKS